ncbi:hypothetical protein NLU13_3726 [Sarocladium strictum]|uniref:Nucleotide-diphospho-sugar transferase domain-containing protein n=1 Tax=Sarocladium strictum TaxID=5046 RepID=A0AA39LAK0_SARSR|nr:hypothetical protein NLU13_3726 [Sarocladium strictum]
MGLEQYSPRGRLVPCLVTTCAVFVLIYFALGIMPREDAELTLSLPSSNYHNIPKDAAKLFAELWRPYTHPIQEPVFITDSGELYEVPPASQRWSKPLGKRVVIIDTDTRLSEDKKNTLLFASSPMEYRQLEGGAAGHLNHYLYALIHGYDYRIVRAPNYKDRYGTWVKPAVLKEALKTHEFVVILDSDAVFTHLQLPIEWLMNLWDITPETLISMAEDVDNKDDYDPQGNLILNTGFVIARASQRSQDMLKAWKDCPNTIEVCGTWKTKWAHEQSAFSYYIRYLFNEPNDVKNIPCDHANGNIYYSDGKGECRGVFVSHNWHSKAKTIEILSQSVMKTVVQRLYHQFQADKHTLFVDGSNHTFPIDDLII